jgi:hypothetical protein
MDQNGTGAGLLGGGVSLIICLAIGVVMIAAMWKLFTKAGQPGWAAIVPIYNIIVLLKIVGKPLWWLILFMIPFVNFVIMILLCIELAKSFGKSTGFGIGLLFLGVIFFPMLAFGNDRYMGPASSGFPVVA